MTYEIKQTQQSIALAAAGASSLGMTLDEALRRPGEPNLLLDMLTAEARKLGVPVPPLRKVAKAMSPAIREELESWHNLLHNLRDMQTPKKDDA